MTEKGQEEDIPQEITTLKVWLRMHYSASTPFVLCLIIHRDALQAVHVHAKSLIIRIGLQ